MIFLGFLRNVSTYTRKRSFFNVQKMFSTNSRKVVIFNLPVEQWYCLASPVLILKRNLKVVYINLVKSYPWPEYIPLKANPICCLLCIFLMVGQEEGKLLVSRHNQYILQFASKLFPLLIFQDSYFLFATCLPFFEEWKGAFEPVFGLNYCF